LGGIILLGAIMTVNTGLASFALLENLVSPSGTLPSIPAAGLIPATRAKRMIGGSSRSSPLSHRSTRIEGDEVLKEDPPPVAVVVPDTLEAYLPPMKRYLKELTGLDVHARFGGEGYHHAMTGQTTRFTMYLAGSHIKDIRYAYASLEGPDIVLGSIVMRPGKTVVFEYTPVLSGNYTLAIDLLRDDGHIPIMNGRWKRIEVVGEDRISKAVEEQWCDSSRSLHWRGRWMRCRSERMAKQEECLRWGYVFRPSDCHYQIWSHDHLVQYSAQSEPRWQVFMGSSRIRGVFLSAVDLLVNKMGNGLKIINKCWGRVDVQLGNLRLTYQDLRSLTRLSYPLPSRENNSFQCHQNHIMVSDFYQLHHNASQFIRHLFKESGDHKPTSLIFEWVPFEAVDVRALVEVLDIPVEETEVNFIALAFRTVMYKQFLDQPPITDEMINGLNQAFGRTVHVIDTLDIVLPFIRSHENGVGRPSHHWHELIPWGSANMSVRGIVTDMLSQMVFNVDFGPRPEELVRSLPEREKVELYEMVPLEVCQDCPVSFIPFTTKPQAELQCYDHFPTADEVLPSSSSSPPATSRNAHLIPCPEWCLEQGVTEMIETQKSRVASRTCPLEKSSQGMSE